MKIKEEDYVNKSLQRRDMKYLHNVNCNWKYLI